MEIYIVMQNVKVNDCFGWHDNGTRPLSAHRSFDVAFDTIFKEYCSIRKKENVSDVNYKDGDEALLHKLAQDVRVRSTDPMFGVQYKFEQWISSVELKDEEASQNG